MPHDSLSGKVVMHCAQLVLHVDVCVFLCYLIHCFHFAITSFTVFFYYSFLLFIFDHSHTYKLYLQIVYKINILDFPEVA